MINTGYIVTLVAALGGATILAAHLSSAETSADAQYVGNETCMSSCHAGAFHDSSDYKGAAAFRQTMHQKIHLRPSPETVVIEKYFAGDSVLKCYLSFAPLPGKDTLNIKLSKTGAEYFVQMWISNQPDSTPRMKVAYTYGGRGWIERFLIEKDGSHYIVPFQYILPGYRQRTADGGGFYYLDFNYWLQLDQQTQEVRFHDQNSNRFRSNAWDKNCAACHVNGFDVARRVRGTDTSWNAVWVGVPEQDSALIDQNMGIGCESCHGPGSEHVANPTLKGAIFNPGALPMTREGTDLKLASCNQCHNRMRSTLGTHRYAYDELNRRPYIPGQLLDSFQADMFKGMNVWPDGITSYAHHQTGQDFLRSKQYASHSYKDGCWDCHTVHHDPEGLPYQLKKDYYSLEDGKGCVTCHGSAGPSMNPALENMLETTTRGGRTVNKHSQHSQDISQCVNCHMSKVASIGFIEIPGVKPLYEFTDHSFRVLRPSLTRTYKDAGAGAIGMINTCAESCHRNGRGSRNVGGSGPAAPAFGISDQRLGQWNEPTDLALADSLWLHYQEMFREYVSAVAVPGVVSGGLRITATAPNPFTTSTGIRFNVDKPATISLEVYSTTGRLVRTLASGRHETGTYASTWDGTTDLGGSLPAGTYVVRLRGPNGVTSATVTLTR